ncbi:hypothetical protein Glove_718g31 [Diversispora epigaea]|uniref:Uncharacterized protein n=1 Tax=Diversispora epigaea TaxID=1348612 RepID=A0A397G0X6_9GLOM|nr:hypothetical protein Glove_718g31 [Diversispora epigaea]
MKLECSAIELTRDLSIYVLVSSQDPEMMEGGAKLPLCTGRMQKQLIISINKEIRDSNGNFSSMIARSVAGNIKKMITDDYLNKICNFVFILVVASIHTTSHFAGRPELCDEIYEEFQKKSSLDMLGHGHGHPKKALDIKNVQHWFKENMLALEDTKWKDTLWTFCFTVSCWINFRE